jgi:uncharacterized membrane protein YeaQ/YmgE (transglycosylase-associated protein family)
VGFLWIIIIGFVAGVIARLIAAGPNTPSGFIVTTVLGIVGAFVATFVGQAVGWYRPDQGAGFIGAIVGAVVLLFIWNRVEASRRRQAPSCRDPASEPHRGSADAFSGRLATKLALPALIGCRPPRRCRIKRLPPRPPPSPGADGPVR